MADDELPNFDIISSLGLQAPESEAKNSGQKNEETNNQRRFAQMDVEELNDVVNDSQAKRTKKATQWAVTVFAGWLQKSRSIFNFYYRKNTIITSNNNSSRNCGAESKCLALFVSNQVANKLLKRFRLSDSELNYLKREITK